MITITDATVEQAALVHRIMIESFAEYLGVLEPASSAHDETVQDVVDDMGKGGAVIAWLGGEPVASARWRIEPDYMYIGRVSVLPAFRGRGNAHAMLDHIENIARHLGITRLRLGVRMVLPQNIELYQKAGYSIAEIIKHPKGNGHAEVAYMEKRLAKS